MWRKCKRCGPVLQQLMLVFKPEQYSGKATAFTGNEPDENIAAWLFNRPSEWFFSLLEAYAPYLWDKIKNIGNTIILPSTKITLSQPLGMQITCRPIVQYIGICLFTYPTLPSIAWEWQCRIIQCVVPQNLGGKGPQTCGCSAEVRVWTGDPGHRDSVCRVAPLSTPCSLESHGSSLLDFSTLSAFIIMSSCSPAACWLYCLAFTPPPCLSCGSLSPVGHRLCEHNGGVCGRKALSGLQLPVAFVPLCIYYCLYRTTQLGRRKTGLPGVKKTYPHLSDCNSGRNYFPPKGGVGEWSLFAQLWVSLSKICLVGLKSVLMTHRNYCHLWRYTLWCAHR